MKRNALHHAREWIRQVKGPARVCAFDGGWERLPCLQGNDRGDDEYEDRGYGTSESATL